MRERPRPKGWGRLVPILVAAALAAILLAGCTGGQPGLAELRRVPGAGAAYPGASEYRRWETEASANVMAKNPATIKVDACASAGQPEVLSWFAERLRRAGWSEDPGHTSVSDTGEYQPQGTSWSRSGFHLELRFLTSGFANQLARAAGEPGGCAAAYETIVS